MPVAKRKPKFPFTEDDVVAAYKKYKRKFKPCTGGFIMEKQDGIGSPIRRSCCPLTIMALDKAPDGQKNKRYAEILKWAADGEIISNIVNTLDDEDGSLRDDFSSFWHGVDGDRIEYHANTVSQKRAFKLGQRVTARLKKEGMLPV